MADVLHMEPVLNTMIYKREVNVQRLHRCSENIMTQWVAGGNKKKGLPVRAADLICKSPQGASVESCSVCAFVQGDATITTEQYKSTNFYCFFFFCPGNCIRL